MQHFRFPREPSKIESTSGSFETDRIMGIPNSECDDGEVRNKQEVVYVVIQFATFNFRQISLLTLIRIASITL